MAITKLGSFEVEYLSVLDENSVVDRELVPANLKDSDLVSLYEHMVMTRVFDDIAISLQREGRIMTYPSSLGQEASIVGSAYALSDNDWLFPSFRECGAFIMRGYPMDKLLQFWSGDERGEAVSDDVKCFTLAIPVATQLPHATGFAWGSKLKRNDTVSMVYFGDGATSKGDCHESMNFAGLHKLPVVFACMNNQWAISVPFARQSSSETLAQRAIAYGFKGIKVDGNDVLAVYSASKDAVDRAKRGDGPTFIELFTYRMGNHTTADDWSRYRSGEEVESWKKKDPIVRMKKFLEDESLWDDDKEEKCRQKHRQTVLDGLEAAEQFDPPKVEDMFNYHYEKLPVKLQEQADELKERLL